MHLLKMMTHPLTKFMNSQVLLIGQSHAFDSWLYLINEFRHEDRDIELLATRDPSPRLTLFCVSPMEEGISICPTSIPLLLLSMFFTFWILWAKGCVCLVGVMAGALTTCFCLEAASSGSLMSSLFVSLDCPLALCFSGCPSPLFCPLVLGK